MNVFVAHLLTQWAAMHSLANTVLGRLARHHSVNDLIHRALTRANIPAIKEPKGLLKSDNKRPDGYSLIPWHAGRNLTWDVSITNTAAASYLPLSSTVAGGAAEMASEKKMEKYAELSQHLASVQ